MSIFFVLNILTQVFVVGVARIEKFFRSPLKTASILSMSKLKTKMSQTYHSMKRQREGL